jgi:hypothetical protein
MATLPNRIQRDAQVLSDSRIRDALGPAPQDHNVYVRKARQVLFERKETLVQNDLVESGCDRLNRKSRFIDCELPTAATALIERSPSTRANDVRQLPRKNRRTLAYENVMKSIGIRTLCSIAIGSVEAVLDPALHPWTKLRGVLRHPERKVRPQISGQLLENRIDF